jgi:Zn-dependent protease with chaperone function
MKRIRFPNISPRAWEHPADRAALSALQSIPGLDMILQQFVGTTSERSLRLVALASAVRVGETQFAKVHTLYREACAVLDVKEPPELFVAFNPFINAQAVGVKKPFIIINSSLLETLSDDELICVLAHELAHCMSGHVLYSTILVMLTRFASPLLMSLPLGGAAIQAIKIALQEWSRKSELSCDRAGLLVCQNPEAAYTLEMKLAGGRHIEQMNINEFFQQAYEYESGGDMIDSIHKVMNLLGESHPFPVLRLVELKKWVDSGEYGRIVGGGYAQEGSFAAHANAAENAYESRNDAPRATMMDNLKTAANRYKDDLRSSNDPLIIKVTDAASAAADKAKEVARDIANNVANGNTGDITDDLANKARQAFEGFRRKEKE